MSRWTHLVWLGVLWLAIPGCATRGTPVARQLSRDIRQLEQLERRDRADGAELARLGALRYLAHNDRAAEADLFQRAVDRAPEDPRVLWRHARTASRDRRFPALLDAAVALLDHTPDGSETELAWRLVAANRAHVTGLPAVLDGWIDGDSLPASTNPVTRDLLLGLVQRRLAARGDRAGAADLLGRRGYLTRWEMAGPAGNDPVDDLWRLPPLLRDSAAVVETGVPFVPVHPGRSGGGVYDAWVTLTVEEPGRWLISATSTSAMILDVDGEVLVERDRWSEYANQQDHGTIGLGAGDHVVHARLATGGTRGSFAVRAVPLSAGDVDAPAEAGLDAPPGTALPALRGAVDAEGRLDLVLAESLAGVAFRGHVDAAALSADLPYSAEAHRRAGLSLLADTSLTDASREPEGTRHLRRALELDPALVGVAVSLARRERSQDPDGARESLQAAVEARPDLVEAWTELIRGYEELSWSTETERALDAALAEAPDRVDLLLEAHGTLAARGEEARARAIAADALAALGTPLDSERADLLEDLGELDQAVAELAELTARDPYDASLWQERIRLARAVGDVEGARELLAEASGRFPTATWPHARLSELALATDGDRAAGHLRDALFIDPSDLELRRRLWRLTGDRAAWLSGDPEPVDYDPVSPEVTVREAIAAYEASPGDVAAYPAVLLRDRREVQVFTGGASIFRLHRIIRLQNRAAVDAYAEVTPGQMEVLAARTWRQDGTPVDADPPLEKDSFSLRDLQAGSTVEIQALSGAGADGGGEDGAYVGPVVSLHAGDEYVRRGELVFLLPPGARYELRGTAPPPERTELPDGGSRLRWEIHDSPPPVPEPFAPAADEYLPWVQLLAWTDLEESLAGARAFQRATTREAPVVTRLADTLARGKPPAEAARAVVDHVRREIRPPASQAEAGAEAVDVLVTGAGSHETAVLAVLKAAGLAVDRVGVRPGYLPPLGDAPRLGSDFPVTLLRVADDGEDLWLDLSDPYVPLGWISPWLRDAELVPLEPPIAPLPSRTPARAGELPGIDADIDLAVDEAGDASGTLRLSLFRQADALMREELWSLPEADRLQSFEGWLSEALPGVAVLAATVEQRAEPDLPVVLHLAIQVPQLFRDRDGTLEAAQLLPDLLPPVDGQSPTLASLVLGGERSAPLLVLPYHESLVVRLSGAGVAGRRLDGWEEATIRLPTVEVSRSAERERSALVLRRVTSLRAGRVQPEDYERTRTLVAAMVSSGRTPVRLIPE